MDWITWITYNIILLIAIKSTIVGSNYSFYYKFKYGKKYSGWYNNRETFEEFLIRIEND